MTICACGGLVRHAAPPDPALPERWQFGAEENDGRDLPGQWWRVFGDAQLDALEERAGEVNRDLARAALRLEIASIDRERIDHGAYPSPSLSASASASRPLRPASAQNNVQIGGVNYSLPSSSGITRSYGLGLALGFEVDVWSRLAALRGAAADREGAASADVDSARFTLAASVAQHYWHIAGIDGRLELARARREGVREAVGHARVRLEAGRAVPTDVSAAQDAERGLESEIADLEYQRQEEVYGLALLLDEPPERFDAGAPRLPEAPPPALPPGIPAALLDRRPDLRAMRLQLDAALRALDAAEAARYPQLSLTAGIDNASDGLSQLLASPFGSVGLGIGGPFLDWKARKLDRDNQRAQLDDAVLAFRGKLYEALRDVELALARRKDDGAALERAKSAVGQASTLAEQAHLRAELGVRSRQDWLDVEGKELSAKAALVQARVADLDGWIALRRALGGPVPMAAPGRAIE